MRKLTKIDFIEKATEIHINKYDYSSVQYKTNKSKVKIICPVHGEFEQTPNSHLTGRGCYKCSKISFVREKKLTNTEFIEKAIDVHGNSYDYSLIDYVDYETKVRIVCPIHGVFEQTPHSHINGSGCQECGNVKQRTINEIIKISNSKHNYKYDYSKINNSSVNSKVIIICPKHGEFIQSINNHINGQGCPICKESKGEKAIRRFLLENDITFIKQKTFKNCKNIRVLPFDFYLPKLNICVEYDGEQHFKPVNRFGGLDGFNKIKHSDSIKNKFCYDNRIKLIRIKYTDNVNDKLKDICKA